MIRNYVLITLRHFLRNKNYTLINILGLSIGITSCLIIFLLISYDLRFDKFHSKYEQIYRIIVDREKDSGKEFSSATPYPLVHAIHNDLPTIPLATQVHYEDEVLVQIDAEKLIVKDLLFADSLFLDVFDFKVIGGNPKEELGKPGKVFVTESLAEKIGYQAHQVLAIKIDNRVEAEVVGIVADPPSTSHIQFSMVISMLSFTGDFIGGMPIDTWSLTASGFTYVVLESNTAPESIEEQLKKNMLKYYPEEEIGERLFKLQPLKDIHFDKVYTDNPGQAANVAYSDLVVMSILGLFILLIASINFINLSTALAIKKSKEIGIRKTLGAKRGQLTLYFLGETFLITSLSVIISLGLVEWILPWLNHFIEKKISLSLLSDPALIAFVLALVIFTTILSGFYPALILSGFNPTVVLKNKITSHNSSGAHVRKVLVVFQFMIAQILIISTLVIANQMEYFKSKPLGFDKEEVIMVPLPDNKPELLQSLRSRLEGNSNIRHITFSIGAPTSDNNFNTNYLLSESPTRDNYQIAVKPVDRHYLDTYGISLIAGRWFTEADEKLADINLPNESQHHVYIVNESAVKRLGFSSPEEIIGKRITTGVNKINSEVVGVINDFHVSSLHNAINPVVLINFPYFYYEAGVKVNSANLTETIAFIEKQWTEVYPEYYFEYSFLDEKLASLYKQDERTLTLFKIFAGVSIFIACLGLYGLVSFMALQKLKEVGIRKVLGASVTSIVVLFSKDFVKLILIAFVLAAPLAWYFMDQWLQDFAYHIDIHWSVFLFSILSTLCIALITVSYRSVKAAASNPSETLRTE